MIIQRKRGLQAVLVLSQGILITVVFVLCALATFNFFTSIIWSQIAHYPIYIFALTAGLFLESFRRDQAGVELSSFEESFLRQHQLSLRQTFYALGVLFVYLVVTKDSTISRNFLALFLPMFYFNLLLSNRYLSRRLAKYLFSGARRGRVLLIGPPAKALLLKEWLKSKALLGIQTIGVLHDAPDEPGAKPFFPRLGAVADAEDVIWEQNVTQVILLELPEEASRYSKLISTLERQGVRLLILNNLEEKLHHPACYLEDGGPPFHRPARGAAGKSAQPYFQKVSGYCHCRAGSSVRVTARGSAGVDYSENSLTRSSALSSNTRWPAKQPI